MSKDSDDCILMNELADGGQEIEREHLIHWKPVAEYDQEGNLFRKLTKEEQQEWIKKEIEKQKQR